MQSKLARLVAVCVMASAGSASAQRVELVGRVKTSAFATMPQRPIGDPRYVALSTCDYGETAVRSEVLDVTTGRVIRIDVPRTTLIRRFGVRGGEESPTCELVAYSPRRAALLVKDVVRERYWYAEIDNGILGRTARVAYFPGETSFGRIRFLGTHADAAWFAIADPETRHITLRRLDLGTLLVSNEAAVQLPVRAKGNGYEDEFTIKTSADFTHFAIAEYHEHGLELDPPARVFVVDAASHTQFSLPTPSTTYGIVFTPDNHYMFLGSSQDGTVTRVDVTARKIDGTLAALPLIHHLAISPDGTHLFVLASSKRYRVFDVPSLLNRKELAHDHGLAAAAEQMFGGGTVTTDGRYLVIDEAAHASTGTVSTVQDPPKDLLIARFVD